MKKNTLTKLVALATVLLVSVGTIAGSTVAWFTDTEYAINTIQSGSLDIGLQYMTKAMFNNTSETDFDKKWENVDPAKQMFNKDALYEPGYTEVVFLKVANIGDLDLKYKLAVQAADTQTGESLIVDTAEGEGDKVLELSDYLKMAAFKVTATDDSSISEQVSDLFTDTAADAATGTAAQSARAKARAKINDTQASTTDGDKIPYLSKGETIKDENGNAVTHDTGKGPIYKVDMFTETKTDDDGNTTTVPATYRLLAEKKDADGTIAIPAGEEVIGLVLYMPEEVGNEANNRGDKKPQIELGIFLEAAQLTSESDSYGSDYDENASFASTSLNSVDRTTSSGENNVIDTYQELKAAIENAATTYSTDTRTTIQIGGNITDYPTSDAAITVPANTPITLDLNGYTVNGGTTAGNMFTLVKGADLTITDTSPEGGGTIARTLEPDLDYLRTSISTNTTGEVGATLTLENVNLTNGAVSAYGSDTTVTLKSGYVEMINISVDAKVNMMGGTINQLSATANSFTMTGGTVNTLVAQREKDADNMSINISENSNVGAASFGGLGGVTATITGGTFTDTFTMPQLKATVNISGGTFQGAVSNEGQGTLTISGGTFNSTISNTSSGTIAISNGEFNGAISNTGTGSITISGGTFNDAIGNGEGNGTISITGGTFKTDPSELVDKDSYTVTEDTTTNTWTVDANPITETETEST